MRKTTLASMLILCGSTAAIAQTMTTPVEQRARNSTGNAMANEMAPGTPATATDNGPPDGVASPTGDDLPNGNTTMGNTTMGDTRDGASSTGTTPGVTPDTGGTTPRTSGSTPRR